MVGGMVIGCGSGLYALDLTAGLKSLWTDQSDAFSDFASLIVSGNRVLASTYHGDLLLMSPTRAGAGIISRLRPFGHDTELYSHPAVSGRRLFIMDGAAICCLDLAPDTRP